MSGELLHSSARVLEFDSLRELLRGYASSPLGQKRIAALAPSTDRDWIENQQQLTGEIREFRRVGGRFDFSGLIDIGPAAWRSRASRRRSRDHRDSRRDPGRRSRRRVARDCAASSRQHDAPTGSGVRALSSQIADFTEFLR